MEARTRGVTPKAALKLYPDSSASPIDRIEVEIERLGAAALALRYRAYGDMSRLKLPDFEAHGRADELWKHTCFEAFVRPAGDEGYLEFNFAGLAWATYRFSSYRDGMQDSSIQPSATQGWLRPDHFEFEVSLAPGRMARPDLPAPAWHVGLSAVIEDVDGGKTYWALAHPADKPDFHHPDSFVLDLPPENP